MRTLIIFLKKNSHPDWVVVDEENSLTLQHGNVEGLSDIALNKRVIVLVPSQEVLLTSIKLPKMNYARLMQALPFAMEDEVIGDVEDLHFVPGEKQADDNTPVAIVSKENMTNWLNQLNELNIQPDVLMPAVFALPVEENTWVIALHEMAIIRMNQHQGFACENYNLAELVQLALNANQNSPEVIHIYNFSQHEIANTLNVPIAIKEDFHKENQFEIFLANNIAKHPHINLLQGDYKIKKSRMTETHKLWKIVAIFATAFVSLLILYPVVSWMILSHRATDIDKQIAVIYKRNFPQASSIVAPKLRMQEKLRAESSGSDNKFLMLMGYLGGGMKNIPGIHLKRLNFQQGKLTLELNASSSEDFSGFTDFLLQAGLKVKQESVNLMDTAVSAIVTVE